MIRIKVGSRTSAIKKAFVHGTRAVRSPPHRQGSTAFMIPARALHEGRTVLDVGLGPRDHVIQVYGANTEVGKTVITAGLLRAASQQGLRASYIKPIQAGLPSDASFVSEHAGTGCRTSTLFDYTDPVSPHLAAARDGAITPDDDILQALVQDIKGALTGGDGKFAHTHVGEAAASSAKEDESDGNLVLVEAAGGVLSPAPSGSLQADAFRPMRLPVLLVGDGKLGGIGGTLSALESLRMRGYSVLGIALIRSAEELGNAEALSRHSGSIPVFELPTLPPPDEPLTAWYDTNAEGFSTLLHRLAETRAAAANDVAGMEARGRKAIWWPFTQHDNLGQGKVNLLDSAYGDYFCAAEVERGSDSRAGGEDEEQEPRVKHRALMDACASWWTQGAGHGNPGMALAIAEAAGRYGHVIFPGNIHAPALEVAERLVNGPGRGWASRAFFTDNGSTATEVAIKMGFRRFLKDRYGSSEPPPGTRLAVVAQEGCYHGDTLGAMNVATPSVYNQGQHACYSISARNYLTIRPPASPLTHSSSLAIPHPYQAKGLFFETPTVSWRDGHFTVQPPPAMSSAATSAVSDELTLSSRDAAFDHSVRDAGKLAEVYREHVRTTMDAYEAQDGAILGSLLLEPLVMGAGGMVFVDPLFQRILVQECRARGMPIIYDEVFCGLWRLGVESSRELLGEDPDVSCYAKLLTGGLVPMSATVATERVFEAFSGAKADCLLHGHSYTAHPVGCAAALEFLSQLEKSAVYPGVGGRMSNSWDEAAIRELSTLSVIDRAFGLGSILAMEMKTAHRGYDSDASAEVVRSLRAEGLYARVLGNVAYVMVSPTTSAEACLELMSIVKRVVERLDDKQVDTEPDVVASII